jgi:hypothetical protein
VGPTSARWGAGAQEGAYLLPRVAKTGRMECRRAPPGGTQRWRPLGIDALALVASKKGGGADVRRRKARVRSRSGRSGAALAREGACAAMVSAVLGTEKRQGLRTAGATTALVSVLSRCVGS